MVYNELFKDNRYYKAIYRDELKKKKKNKEKETKNEKKKLKKKIKNLRRTRNG